jgi:hypothetical protein
MGDLNDDFSNKVTIALTFFETLPQDVEYIHKIPNPSMPKLH